MSASLGTRPGPGQRPHCGAMDPHELAKQAGDLERGSTTSTSTIRSRRAAATRASSSYYRFGHGTRGDWSHPARWEAR